MAPGEPVGGEAPLQFGSSHKIEVFGVLRANDPAGETERFAGAVVDGVAIELVGVADVVEWDVVVLGAHDVSCG